MMSHLTRVEYCPGDGTKYNLLIGKARPYQDGQLQLFIAKMDDNSGTSAILPDGDFNHWTYVAEKLRCGEIAARAVAHFINLRFHEPYKEMLKQHIGGIEGLQRILPPCFFEHWEDYPDTFKRFMAHHTVDEVLDIALSITHGVTYADTLYVGPYGVGENTPVPLYMGPFGAQEHPPEPKDWGNTDAARASLKAMIACNAEEKAKKNEQ